MADKQLGLGSEQLTVDLSLQSDKCQWLLPMSADCWRRMGVPKRIVHRKLWMQDDLQGLLAVRLGLLSYNVA